MVAEAGFDPQVSHASCTQMSATNGRTSIMGPTKTRTLICYECGRGHLARPQALMIEADRMRGCTVLDFVCTACGVESLWADYEADAGHGQLLVVTVDGLLAVVSAS